MLWTMVLGLLLLVGCNNSDDTLGNWVKKSAFEGIPRGSAVSFVIGDKAYMGLGYNSDDDNEFKDEYLKDFWVYNPTTDKWIRVANFPGKGRTDAVGFSVNGKGYVATGYNGDDGGNKLSDVWEYDPTTDKWIQKDDFAGGVRADAVAFNIGNYGYVGTGVGESSSEKNDFYRFDPTAAKGSQWTKSQSISGDKRIGATVFVNNSKAYVCTGTSNSSVIYTMYEYDPTKDSWTEKIKLNDDDNWNITRKNASSFVLDGKGYVCVGESSGTLKTVWEYDIAGNTWVQKTDFEGSARTKACGFTLGSKAFIVGGQSGSSYYLDDVWEFKPFDEYDDED